MAALEVVGSAGESPCSLVGQPAESLAVLVVELVAAVVGLVVAAAVAAAVLPVAVLLKL